MQTSIRKLAESIQTVKTVLAVKIQSEQKLVSAFSHYNHNPRDTGTLTFNNHISYCAIYVDSNFSGQNGCFDISDKVIICMICCHDIINFRLIYVNFAF